MEQTHSTNTYNMGSPGGMARTSILSKIISIKNIGNIVPIISNSFRIEQIFRSGKNISDLFGEDHNHLVNGLTIHEQLTKLWAREVGYPETMSDDHNLARVAQYYQVEQFGSDVAKEDYLEFLKRILLHLNAGREGYESFVEGHRKDFHLMSFSDLVKGLDYPQFPQGGMDPLTTLARMPFPIYVTTSPHDFLERALLLEDKQPRTQVIFWEPGREYDEAIELKHTPDPTFNPTVTNPAVYHLFGLENYPGSLVLSEDDHLNFLVSLVSEIDTMKQVVPLRLRRALSASHLLLLGYHLQDWDFRILFRYILNHRQSEMAKQGVFIQLKPEIDDPRLFDYLKHYFNMKKFEIEWKTTEEFIETLWKIWKGQQQ
jgi:hypothetical protein